MLVRRAFNRADAGSYTSLHNLTPHYDQPMKSYQLPRDLVFESPNEGKVVEDPTKTTTFMREKIRACHTSSIKMYATLHVQAGTTSINCSGLVYPSPTSLIGDVCHFDKRYCQCNRELPKDVSELIRDMNAALHRAGKYPKCENKSRARAIQRKVKARMKEVRNENWSNLVLHNTYSSMRPIRVGVPQGSMLFPRLHSVYVNDIPRPSTGVQLVFSANDTALYLRSNCIGNILARLQRAIDEPTQWLRLWRIDINTDTGASIYFDYNTHKVQFPCRINSAVDAPWYVKNSVLHRDLELPTISTFMKDASERFFDEASSHPNPLLVLAVSYEPSPLHHFCRRPRNVPLDPPDDLTIEVEILIELNKMSIDYE
ncbi:RNA-directed DNA polymerase from mobile element jockey [Eumeta japonica]|uniref:RNA-directed DNA polymerase from mobile element jockey n=1 Tax=Eumeta variegata TaxID=151549 RepID=A0A4C1TQX6_EUMVA|nr:RNA-directed DNA polymerase from mobile element jockey [Eumeta japonica]